MKIIKSYIKILRPNVVFLGFLFALLGNLISGKINLLSLLSISLLIGAGNVINDYFDYEIDKINRPDRVLPKGELSLKRAYFYFILLSFFGVISAYFVNFIFFLGALLSVVISYFYAKYFKRFPFIGNFIVALLSVSSFIFGILANTYKIPNFALDVAFLCFFGSLAREILKDLEDIEGDSKIEAKTIPIVFGETFTKVLAILFVLISSYFAYKLNILLFLLCLLSVPIIWFFDSSVSQRYLKLIMFFTFVVLIYIYFFS